MAADNNPPAENLQAITIEDTVNETTSPPFPYRLAWDDENVDFNFKSRTMSEGWNGKVRFPPAVLRYYPVMKDKAGDFRVDITAWKNFFMDLNQDIKGQKFEYWSGTGLAQFNQTGWPKLMYVGMSGNYLDGAPVDKDWFRFNTLKVTDVAHAQGMTRTTHPQFIHTFTCVGWKDGQTVRVPHTGTPRGSIDYPLVTNEGFAYIPLRHVVKVG